MPRGNELPGAGKPSPQTKKPLVPPLVMLGTGLAAVLFSGVPSFFLVLAIYLQSGFGLSPLQSGMTTLPFSVGVLIASVVAGLLGPRWQRQRITVGALLLMTAMLWLRVVVGATFDTVTCTVSVSHSPSLSQTLNVATNDASSAAVYVAFAVSAERR